MDTLTPEERSRVMSRVRAADTKPELAVRSLAHRLGFRFRLRRRDLPGKPDLVFPKHRAAVFVHGCFWHRHEGCKLARLPKSRLDFWGPKLEGNATRDRRNEDELRRLGWRVLVIWECEVRDRERLAERLTRFLSAAAEEAGHGEPSELEEKHNHDPA